MSAFHKSAMKKPSSETIWQMTETELLAFLKKTFRFRTVRFYAPSFMYYKTRYYCSSSREFPTISITGKGCALECKHCGGKVLETMYPANTSEKLFNLCQQLKRDGASGCLISGGCLPDGSVPIERFVDTIEKVKRELGLTVFVHTGIIDSDTARKLKNAGADAALIDVIGSDETIREIYNLNTSVKDYENSLSALHQADITFVPHVIVGLHYGNLKGEFDALKMISKYNPTALVIIAFMPIHGTKMADIKPPEPMDIVRVITAARLEFPETPLVLGCMRPKGKHRVKTDILAIEAGVDAIAFPAEEAIKFAEKQGCNIAFSSFCCAQIYRDVKTAQWKQKLEIE